MLKEFLKNAVVSPRNVYEELDKTQLLYMTLWDLCPDQMHKLPSDFNSYDSLAMAAKSFGANMRKIRKDYLIEDLMLGDEAAAYEQGHLELLYKQFYNTDITIIADTKLLALSKIINTLFGEKLKSGLSEILDDLSLVKDDYEQLYDKYFLKDKPTLNFLGAIALLSKLDRFSNESGYSNITPLAEIKKDLLERMLYYFCSVISKDYGRYVIVLKDKEKNIKNLEYKLTKKEEAANKAKESLKKANIEKKELSKQITELSKKPSKADTEMVTKLYEDIRKKDELLAQKDKEIKAVKEKPTNMYKSLMDDLNNQIYTLKEQNGKKTSEIKDIKKQLQEHQSRSLIDTIVNNINEKGLSKELFDTIYPYCQEYIARETIKDEVAITSSSVASIIEEPKKTSNIGYCIVEGDKHFAALPGNRLVEIRNIPENTYIGDKQFILLDEEDNFRKTFPYVFEAYDNDFAIKNFLTVSLNNNEVFGDKGYSNMVKLNRIPQHLQLRDKQIIAVDGENNFVRYYKPSRFNMDTFIKSAKAKEHTFEYVLKIFPNGLMLRNMETGIEHFKPLNLEGHEIKEQQILAVASDERIVTIFSSSRFYTLSTYYKKAEYGTVELKEDRVFIRKLSGEIVLVNDTPANFELMTGQVINIDEYNNYLSLRLEDTPVELRKPFLNSASYKKKTDKDPKEKIELTKTVYIVGNLNFENSYKLAAYKIGYKATVIEGYTPWEKVRMAVKDGDLVVIIRNHASHDNMWKLRDSIDVPCIFPDYDGANRVADEILMFEELQKAKKAEAI